MSVIGNILRDARLRTVLGFALACLVGFGYLWVKAGGSIPGVAGPYGYTVSFNTSDIKNLRSTGDVRIAGVVVGRVESTTADNGKVRVTLSLNSNAAPLHSGVKFRIGVKSLVGSSFVNIVDGTGATLPSGTTVPASAVTPAVDVDELFSMLDAPTRKNLSAAVQGLGVATNGTGQSVSSLMIGLGQIADPGGQVLHDLATQGKDIQDLSLQARRLLDALDTGQGQIADLVSNAQQLTAATAAKREALQSTVRQLPGLIGSLNTGAQSLDQLAGPLAPVAASLRQAAPDLAKALENLPATTNDLHGLLPSLNQTLVEAPATLTALPGFDASLRSLVPTAQATMADVTPMLSYLAPYGEDLGALFGNFGGSFDTVAEDGIIPIRLTATAEGTNTIRGVPVKLPGLGLSWNNPYPSPLTVDQPSPFKGAYPRVHPTAK